MAYISSIEFITEAAIHTALEQFPNKTLDDETVKHIREKAASTVEELSITVQSMKTEGTTYENAVSHLSPDE